MAITKVNDKVVNGQSDIDGLKVMFNVTFHPDITRYVLSVQNEDGLPATCLYDDGNVMVYSCPISQSNEKKQSVYASMIKSLETDVKPYAKE